MQIKVEKLNKNNGKTWHIDFAKVFWNEYRFTG